MGEKKGDKRFPFRDFLIILFCLSGAAGCLFLFWKDLNIIFDPHKPPVGFITNKVMVHNAVQRQQEDRELWERLLDDSPVYSGDLIWVAKSSEAVLHINNRQITLSENTRIRIQKTKENLPEIEFFSGSLIIDGDPENKIIVKYEGKRMTALPSNDPEKVFRPPPNINDRPSVLVTSPWNGKRYLKKGSQMPNIDFAWERFNIEPGEALLLEIAADWKFTRIAQALDTTAFKDTVTASCDTGVWYWRLSYRGTPLTDAKGRVIVTDTSGPALYSPATESVFRYQSRHPDLHFRWSEVDGALYYLLEVAETQGFDSPIEKRVYGTSFSDSSFGQGTWFWRVQPVFSPDDYKGGFSSVASFSIEQKPPVAPSPITPLQGETVDIAASRNIYFSWTGSNEAVSYTVQISAKQNPGNHVINRTVRDNSYVYDIGDGNLSLGEYNWNVYYTNGERINSPSSDDRSFTITEVPPWLRLVSPPDDYTIATALLPDIIFKWESNVRSQKRLQISARPDFSQIEIDEPVPGNSFHGFSLPPGDWYWRIITVDAVAVNTGARQESLTTPARHFRLISALSAPVLVLPQADSQVQTGADRPVAFEWKRVDGAEYYRFKLYTAANQNDPVYERIIHDIRQTVPTNTLAEGDYSWTVQAVASESAAGTRQTGGLSKRQFTLQKAFMLTLESPAQGTEIPGLTALRQPTVFRWNTAEEVGRSRFVFSRNSDPLRGQPAVEIPNPGRAVSLDRLEEGVWYWTVEARTPDGSRINAGAPRQLRVLPIPPLITLESPVVGAELPGLTVLRQPTIFRWSTAEEVGRSRFVLSRNSDPLRGRPAVEIPNPQGRTVSLNSLEEGVWYWTVEAWTPDNIRINARAPRQFRVLPIPTLITLESPAAGAELPGLTALREQIVFRWSTGTEVGRSRFVLSRDSDPLQRGQPVVEITNPQGRTVSLDGPLGEGVWYWTVEVWTPDNIRINAAAPRRLRVLPVPLLPEPGNRQPSKGYIIGADELRKLRAKGGLVFSWATVNGANAYIFTLSQETNNGRRQIDQIDLSQTEWILDTASMEKFLVLQGTFVWQVEAVNRGRNGTIEQHGQIGENTFYMDVPPPNGGERRGFNAE